MFMSTSSSSIFSSKHDFNPSADRHGCCSFIQVQISPASYQRKTASNRVLKFNAYHRYIQSNNESKSSMGFGQPNNLEKLF